MKKLQKPEKKNLVPGSKIPITFLLDYIKEGYSLDEFIKNYPWIKKASLKKALDEIKNREFTAGYAL